MKNSIKLKHGDELGKLLKYPKELAGIITIAFFLDEDLGFSSFDNLEIVAIEQGVIDNLILWGFVSESKEGYSITSKKIIDITLKKAPEKDVLKSKRMCDLEKNDIPADELEYFKIAQSFRELFLGNLKSIKARLINVERATYGKWVDPIRLMMQNDDVTVEDLRDVWKFLDKHPFWSANVQSTSKLRDKFQTIHSQLKRDGKQSVSKKAGGNVSSNYLEGVIRDLQSD